METQTPILAKLEFMERIYNSQCVYCCGIRIRCKTHYVAGFAAEYSKRLYHHEVGQNLNLVKIDTDYFHQFECLISGDCETALCMECRTVFRNGDITYHTQFIRIRYLESWIVSVLRNLLHSICRHQIRDARMLVPTLQQNHVVLPEQPRELEAEE